MIQTHAPSAIPIASAPGALAASVPRYPAEFVIPDREPYAFAVDMAVIRSEMAAGNARQRRAYRIMPHALALSFHMRIEELYLWQNWVNEYAYTYFLCPVSTMYAGGPPVAGNIRYEVLRFTSDLAVQMEGWNFVGVQVSAELANDAQTDNPPIGVGDWIIGGTPRAPNSALWYVAGTPGNPSNQNRVNAGTPAFPSAFVGV